MTTTRIEGAHVIELYKTKEGWTWCDMSTGYEPGLLFAGKTGKADAKESIARHAAAAAINVEIRER